MQSRVEVNKQRKRRPPSRRLVKSMYEQLPIQEEISKEVEAEAEAPTKQSPQQMHKVNFWTGTEFFFETFFLSIQVDGY